jgi:hypothetical protein
MTHIAGCTPPGARFFQWPKKPCARIPAAMIRRKLIVASAAVTFTLPVGVVPPCVSFVKKESSGRCRTVWFNNASTSKIGSIPSALIVTMNRKNIMISGK